MAENKPNKIIWHHSYRPLDNKYLKDFDNIKNYHIKHNGWKDIGYHWVIEYSKNKLQYFRGRKDYQTAAHTIGQNAQSIGICVLGNWDEFTPTQEVYKKCAELYYKEIVPTWGELPHFRHSDFSNKTCPGKKFDINEIIKNYENIKNHSKNHIEKWKVDIFEKSFKRKIIKSESWKENLNGHCPTWAVMEMINNAMDQLKKELKNDKLD